MGPYPKVLLNIEELVFRLSSTATRLPSYVFVNKNDIFTDEISKSNMIDKG